VADINRNARPTSSESAVYRLEDLQAWVELGAKASTSDPGVGTVLPAKRHTPVTPISAGQARR
jgi:hypothetical protein